MITCVMFVPLQLVICCEDHLLCLTTTAIPLQVEVVEFCITASQDFKVGSSAEHVFAFPFLPFLSGCPQLWRFSAIRYHFSLPRSNRL